MTWWNAKYPYRRNLTVTSIGSDAPVDHPVTLIEPLASLVTAGKMRADFGDAEILHFASPTWTVIGRSATPSGSDISFEFKLFSSATADLIQEDQYFLYYGNKALSATPARPSYTTTSWPVSATPLSPGVSYTRPGDHWIDGVSSTKNSVATFTFSGSKVRWIARTGDYGIANVSIDGSTPIQVDLFSATPVNSVAVYTSPTLFAGDHTLTIMPVGRRNPSSLTATINIVRFEYLKNVVCLDLGEEIDGSITWGSSTGGA